LLHGYSIVDELPEDDKGASGAAFELPALNRIREMAHNGEFDVLVVREIDRLSRSLAKQLIVEEELKRNGVQIEYVLGEYPDTPEGNLMKNIKASIAEYERLKINERMIRGKALKVQAGSVMVNGHRIYGYLKATNGEKWTLEVYEPEAQIARLIFEWYVVGDGYGPLSLQAIRERLEQMGVPTLVDNDGGGRGRKTAPPAGWARSSVYQILCNETYTGTWRYGKQSKTGQTGEVSVPSIISREVFDLAAARRAHNKEVMRCRGKREYLLSGLLKCGFCGRNVASHTKTGTTRDISYYCCKSALHSKDRRCSARVEFRGEVVESRLWEWVRSFLLEPAVLTEGLADFQEARELENAPIRDRLRVVEGLLADNRGQLERLLDLYIAGEFPKELLAERKNRLETTIGALDREQAALLEHLQDRILTEAQIRTLQEFTAKVANDLETVEPDSHAKRRVLEALDATGSLTVEDGQRVLYARCILGQTNGGILLSGSTHAGAAAPRPP
jgi:site-specific DNA recombinase